MRQSIPKDFLEMMQQATKAPSGHNTQPWLFEVDEKSIGIHPDMSKALPVVDPLDRELFISLGGAAENLCLTAAALGYITDISITPENSIRILPEKIDGPVDLPFRNVQRLINVRQSNRSIYNDQIIEPETIGVLQSLPLPDGIHVHFRQNGEAGFNTLSDLIQKGNSVQMSDTAFKDELKSWMRFNKKHVEKSPDGLSYEVFGAPNLPLFIVKPLISMMLNPKSQNKEDRKRIDSSSHFALFTVEENNIASWIELGRYMQRFMLKLTELGIAHGHCNQPCEVDKLSIELSHKLNLGKEIPVIILRLGYGSIQPYSPRRNYTEKLIC